MNLMQTLKIFLSHIFYTTRKHYTSLFSGSMKMSMVVNSTTLVKYMQLSKERCKQTSSLSHVPGDPCPVLESSSSVWKILWQTRSPVRSSRRIMNITATFSSIAVRTISVSMTASALQKHIHSLNWTGFFHMDAARVSPAELTTRCLCASSSKQAFCMELLQCSFPFNFSRR